MKNPELKYEEIKQYLIDNGFKLKSPDDSKKFLHLLKYDDPLIIAVFDIDDDNKVILKDLKKLYLTGLLYNEHTDTVQANSRDENGYHRIDIDQKNIMICGYHCHIINPDDADFFLENFARKYKSDIKKIIKNKEKSINVQIKERRKKIDDLEKVQYDKFRELRDLSALRARLNGKDLLLNAKIGDIMITRCGIEVIVDYIKPNGINVTCITDNEDHPNVDKHGYSYFSDFTGKMSSFNTSDFDIIKKK